MQENKKNGKIAIGCVTNYGMAVHKPQFIRVAVSNDNKTFREVGTLRFTQEEIFREGTFKEDHSLDFEAVTARYVRVMAEGAGECPANHVRPGQEARVYFDEVIIE